MNITDLAEFRVAREVDRLFRENPPRHGQQCVNPVTGGWYLGGDDPIAPQKRAARRALLAREWFALNGPPDAQPLPLSAFEIEKRKYMPGNKQPSLDYIVSCFAYSFRARRYDPKNHPSFADFARGVTASEYAPYFVKNDEELRRRYPPRHLHGLNPGHCWEPSKDGGRTMASTRRSQARAAP
jgi:hypothetical protein